MFTVLQRIFQNKKYGPINLYTYVSLLVLVLVHIFNFFTQLPLTNVTVTFGLLVSVSCVVFFTLALTKDYWLFRLRHAYVIIACLSISVLAMESIYYPSGFLLMGIWSTMISFLFVFPNIRYVVAYAVIVLLNFYLIYSNFVHHPEIKITTGMFDLIPGALMIISIVGSTSYFRELTDRNTKELEMEIEHRKNVETKLEKLNRVYTGIAENIPLQIAVLTPEGRYEFANSLMEPNNELRNYIYGMTDMEFFSKFSPSEMHIALKRAKAIKEAVDTLGEIGINEIVDERSCVRYYFPTKKTTTGLIEIISYGWEIKERKS